MSAIPLDGGGRKSGLECVPAPPQLVDKDAASAAVGRLSNLPCCGRHCGTRDHSYEIKRLQHCSLQVLLSRDLLPCCGRCAWHHLDLC